MIVWILDCNSWESSSNNNNFWVYDLLVIQWMRTAFHSHLKPISPSSTVEAIVWFLHAIATEPESLYHFRFDKDKYQGSDEIIEMNAYASEIIKKEWPEYGCFVCFCSANHKHNGYRTKSQRWGRMSCIYAVDIRIKNEISWNTHVIYPLVLDVYILLILSLNDGSYLLLTEKSMANNFLQSTNQWIDWWKYFTLYLLP